MEKRTGPCSGEKGLPKEGGGRIEGEGKRKKLRGRRKPTLLGTGVSIPKKPDGRGQ